MKNNFLICMLVLVLVLGWKAACFGDFYVIAAQKKNFAPVEKTKQVTCYDESGTVISCSGTGQDGDLQAGVTWPRPRFKDNGDGTVTDNLTKLIWLKNANCAGATKSWFEALTYCQTLNSGQCGLTDDSVEGDWRLPNVKELQSLIHYGFYSPALPNTAGTGQWAEGDPFINVQPSHYWSATTYVHGTNNAYWVYMSDGVVAYRWKINGNYVWPVRAGH